MSESKIKDLCRKTSFCQSGKPMAALLGLLLVNLGRVAGFGAVETNYVRGQLHELNDNGAWSWFMDERVIVDDGRLIVGSVRANGKFADKDRPGWGNVELA